MKIRLSYTFILIGLLFGSAFASAAARLTGAKHARKLSAVKHSRTTFVRKKNHRAPKGRAAQEIGACVTDCSWDGQVTVDELVKSVQIGLGNSSVNACVNADSNGDGEVTVDELISGVNAALNGCDYTIPTVSNVQLYYHDGSILHTVKPVPVFWGPDWSDPNFAQDKITGLDTFFYGFDGSDYSTTLSEYDDQGGSLAVTSVYDGYITDEYAAPDVNPLSTDDTFSSFVDTVVSEACYNANDNPDPNEVYFLYTPTYRQGSDVDYCAFHSYGTCSTGAPIQVSYVPNLDGDPDCDPIDTTSDHSQGLAALANVSAHELVESVTDPRDGGWYNDYSFEEVADKCNFTFPNRLGGMSRFADGTDWKLQMVWSNYAYLDNTGYPTGPDTYNPDLNGCIY